MPASKLSEPGVRRAVAIGESSGPGGGGGGSAADSSSSGGGGGDAAAAGGIDDLQARLDNLRRD
jgi:charged multivesicular body protein 2A